MNRKNVMKKQNRNGKVFIANLNYKAMLENRRPTDRRPN